MDLHPWSLYGLALTLKEQGHERLEPEVMKRFRKAWSRADMEMTNPLVSHKIAKAEGQRLGHP